MRNAWRQNPARKGLEHRQINRPPRLGDAEVPAAEWGHFLKSFSIQHSGWIVNVFTVSAEKKYQRIFHVIGRQLRHMRIDWNCRRPEVQISLAGQGGDLLIHRVPDPTRLVLKQDSEGAHEGLDVTSADGSVTRVRFRVPARPETLDGVLPLRQSAEPTCAGWRIPIEITCGDE